MKMLKGKLLPASRRMRPERLGVGAPSARPKGAAVLVNAQADARVKPNDAEMHLWSVWRVTWIDW
jgi:hypothetical protein